MVFPSSVFELNSEMAVWHSSLLPQSRVAMRLLLITVLAIAIASTNALNTPLASQSHCTSDLSCSLNGECSQATGKCLCNALWKGDACEKLVLSPLEPSQVEPNTAAYRHGSKTSWGASILKQDADEKYHMFVSVMAHNCTLSSWVPNSRIVHSTSDTLLGPYSEGDVIFDTFHHNPTVRKLPNGEGYVMYLIGKNVASTTDCSSIAADADQAPRVSWAPSLDGPWSDPSDPILQGGGRESWDYLVTNPSPLFLPNGTVLLYYRGSPYASNENDLVEHIGLAKAEHWKGPYSRVSDTPIVAAANEDPFVWCDSPSGHFHMLAHGGDDDWQHIHHAFSQDGLVWSKGDTISVTPDIQLTNGSTIHFTQRERPQIYFDFDDDRGTASPKCLVSGVCPGEKYEYAFTVAQLIGC